MPYVLGRRVQSGTRLYKELFIVGEKIAEESSLDLVSIQQGELLAAGPLVRQRLDNCARNFKEIACSGWYANVIILFSYFHILFLTILQQN